MKARLRHAAAVVLARSDGPDAEVFLVKRSPEQRFFPDYWAFPGGTFEDDEDALACAVRELREETTIDAAPKELVDAGRVVTPELAPVRYDTRFYLLRLQDDAEPVHVEGELVDGRWFRPSDALAAFDAQELLIPPPVLAMLTQYALHRPSRAAAAVRDTDHYPHHQRFPIVFHPGISLLPLATPTLPPATTTNAVLIGDLGYRLMARADDEGGADGQPVLVVDPGPADDASRVPLWHALGRLWREGHRVEAVVLTHHHSDHVGAARDFADEADCLVLAHEETARALPEGVVDESIDDGHVFDLGVDAATGREWKVEVLHTPGHTPGHLTLRDTRFGCLVVGDVAAGLGTVIVDPPEGDMAAYFATLERLRDLDPPMLIPGHGPALPKGRRAIEKLLDHRRMREAKVVAALGTAPRPVEAMLDEVYDDVKPELRPLGARSLLAHLLKLEGEGKVERDGEGWRAT